MAYDYADDQEFGMAEVAEYGRVVTLQRYTSTPTSTERPWEGNPPAGLPAEEYSTHVVFVPPSSASQLGLRGLDEALLKRFEQLAICGHAPDGSTPDLRNFDMILDADQTLWRILWSETLRPGAVNVLYFFGVAR